MRTVSCIATLALRMRVNMSAIGSVIVMANPLPTGLGDAGDLTGVHQLTETDSAQPELTEDRPRAAAAATAGVAAHLELRLALLLLDQCLLRHAYCTSRRNGNPKASSSARPSASVWADVTIEMSIPPVGWIWCELISGKVTC